MAEIDTTLDNIVSHWELEEASGTRVDSHGSNDLSPNGSPGNATGVQGNGVDLEQSSTQTLSVADASQTGLDYTGDHSHSLWIKPETLPTTNGTLWGLFSKDTVLSNRSYTADLYYSGGSLKIRYACMSNSTGTIYQEATWTQALSTGTLYHLVFTYDTSQSGTDRFKFYVNGTLNTVKSFAFAGSFTTIYSGTAPFIIGNYDYAITPYDGIIDEFTTTSDVITSGEVTTIYNGGAGIPYTAGGGGGAVLPQFKGFARL